MQDIEQQQGTEQEDEWVDSEEDRKECALVMVAASMFVVSCDIVVEVWRVHVWWVAVVQE